MRLVVAVTGATGSIYAVKLLEALKANEVDVHLIVSHWAEKTLQLEMGLTVEDIQKMSGSRYEEDDLAAPVSSGSFQHDGMVIIPCSMKTLAAIAHGFDENLIVRAADVTLKERRRLILVPRETPLIRGQACFIALFIRSVIGDPCSLFPSNRTIYLSDLPAFNTILTSDLWHPTSVFRPGGTNRG
jgi:polyprenyl P-hydroxybenzoate/phenylacrylic acid decarboxylase-like protein